MSESHITSYLAVVLSLVALLLYRLKKSYNYWASKGVAQLEPMFPLGDITLTNLMQPDFNRSYKKFKSKGEAHGGIYMLQTPIWVPVDINLIKTIMVKDFEHFRNHGLLSSNRKMVGLAAHLFNLEDDRWRSMRVKLTPTFTSGKMKMMFPTFLNCTTGLTEIMNEHAVEHAPIEIKEILARFTTDIISNCAFGLECNSLKNPDEEFRKQGRELFEVTGTRKAKLLLLRFLPTWISRSFRLGLIGRDFEDFFVKAVQDIVEYREQNNVFRRDFMHLLLQLKNRGKVTDDENIKDSDDKTHEHLDIVELAAQCFVFFIAGFETSSSAMTFGLYELAKAQALQDKLRKEIREVLERHGDKFTYEAISEMTYLDQVVKETLSMYPPIRAIPRKCSKNYTVPGSNIEIEKGTFVRIPVYETLRMYPPIRAIPRKCSKNYTVPGSNIEIEKGTFVRIPVYAIHMDPEYYPEPEKFDPERFTKENETKRPPFSWIPFGEGPRLCIGMRFGMLQTKVGIATIIRDFKVSLNVATPTTLKFKSELLIAQCKNNILLDVEKVPK